MFASYGSGAFRRIGESKSRTQQSDRLRIPGFAPSETKATLRDRGAFSFLYRLRTWCLRCCLLLIGRDEGLGYRSVIRDGTTIKAGEICSSRSRRMTTAPTLPVNGQLPSGASRLFTKARK